MKNNFKKIDGNEMNTKEEILSITLLKSIYYSSFNKVNEINIEVDVLPKLTDSINKLRKKLENKGPEEIIETYKNLKGKSYSEIIDLFEIWYKRGIINEYIIEFYCKFNNIYVSIFVYIFIKKILEELDNNWENLEEEEFCIKSEDIESILTKEYKTFKKYL